LLLKAFCTHIKPIPSLIIFQISLSIVLFQSKSNYYLKPFGLYSRLT
jgi:hypothetical protein